MVRCSRVAACCAFVAIGAAAMAGPLNPPAGPVAPSADPPGEIEPRININALVDGSGFVRITQAGSYYLTANLVIQTLRVEFDQFDGHAHIDLNGFTVSGNGFANIGVVALGADSRNDSVTIENGAVSGFGIGSAGFGITAERALIRNVRAVSQLGAYVGIRATDSVLVGCRASASTSFELTRCLAVDCEADFGVIATDSTLTRLRALCFEVTGSNLERCVSNGAPAEGFEATESVLTECESIGSGDHGFLMSSSTADGCQARDNNGNGFTLFGASQLRGCRASGNAEAGISAFERATITDCHAHGNTLDGISLGGGCRAVDCTSTLNGALGYFVNDGSSAEGCTAEGNVNTGFGVGLESRAINCSAVRNGNAGFVAGAGVTGIEITDCSAISNSGTGFLQDSPSLIARNRASGNGTNYNIPLAGAFPISSAGAGVDAWDNIEY